MLADNHIYIHQYPYFNKVIQTLTLSLLTLSSLTKYAQTVIVQGYLINY